MRGERESRRAGELGSEGGSMDCDSCPRNGRLRYERAEPRLAKPLWSRRATALGRELKRSARRRSPGSMNSRPNPIRWTTSVGVSRPREAEILIPSTDRSARHSSHSRTSQQHMTPPAFPFRHVAPYRDTCCSHTSSHVAHLETRIAKSAVSEPARRIRRH